MGKKATILIVDDQEYNRIILHDIMVTLNYQPVMAENGKIALDLLEHAKVDLIILDIMMPVMNGFELLDLLKKDESLRHIPVVVMSALTDEENIAKGIRMGAEDFLAKPFNPLILKARIGSCLARKQLHDLEEYRNTLLEKELDEARTQIIHSDRLAGLGQVSASIAHDVNNKISAIINRVSIMTRKDEILDDKITRNLAKILEICRGSTVILRHLLDYSGGDKTEFETVDINIPIENAISLVEHKITTSGVEIDFQRFPEPLIMKGNSDQLEQVFMNLFINANDAMAQGGKLTISVSKSNDLADSSIAKNNHHYIKIDVKDTGEGIPIEIQEKIFLPFFTTKPRGKGTGLGMYIIKQITDAHSGRIMVVSERGKGTLITLMFPR